MTGEGSLSRCVRDSGGARRFNLHTCPDEGSFSPSQAGDAGGDGLEQIINLRVRCLVRERQADGAVRLRAGAAEGEEHMARIDGPGGAGRASRDADARLIEQEKKCFAVDALEAEVHDAGQAVRRAAV